MSLREEKTVIARQCAHWRGNPFFIKGDGFPRKTATQWVAVLLGMTGNLIYPFYNRNRPYSPSP